MKFFRSRFTLYFAWLSLILSFSFYPSSFLMYLAYFKKLIWNKICFKTRRSACNLLLYHQYFSQSGAVLCGLPRKPLSVREPHPHGGRPEVLWAVRRLHRRLPAHRCARLRPRSGTLWFDSMRSGATKGSGWKLKIRARKKIKLLIIFIKLCIHIFKPLILFHWLTEVRPGWKKKRLVQKIWFLIIVPKFREFFKKMYVRTRNVTEIESNIGNR